MLCPPFDQPQRLHWLLKGLDVMPVADAPRFLERVALDNGLQVEFYNASRAIAGDRMQVVLLIRIPLNVDRSHFAECADGETAYREFVQAFGARIWFEQRKVRNFIDRQAMETVLRQLQDDFLKINQRYLNRNHFATRCILRRYRNWKERHASGPS